MTKETSKASLRRKNDSFYEKIFVGDGIDIGCGDDILNSNKEFPLISSVTPFDQVNGDAQIINSYIKRNFDFVHSSQCLEHMVCPKQAIVNWFSLVKPNGYLIITIPDEDLYEQGHFPSRWNNDHKWTFSIYKKSSWSDKHINVIDLVKELNGSADVIRISLIDTNYDYKLLNQKLDVDQTLNYENKVEAFIEIVIRKREWTYN